VERALVIRFEPVKRAFVQPNAKSATSVSPAESGSANGPETSAYGASGTRPPAI